MKIWLSKNSEISLREQLTRQIMLAIVSGDLKPDDKLPSIREISLRHKIHANTASAAYRWLEKEGWVSLRIGSGVYVGEIPRVKIDETSRRQDVLLPYAGRACEDERALSAAHCKCKGIAARPRKFAKRLRNSLHTALNGQIEQHHSVPKIVGRRVLNASRRLQPNDAHQHYTAHLRKETYILQRSPNYYSFRSGEFLPCGSF